jgi:hypothetical protein
MNYIYDNSIEQIQNIDLKTIELNFLEEYK